VFENRVLGRIFGPRRDEVKRGWRILHNEELNDLYSSPNVFRVTKSRRLRWTRHVARMGERRSVYSVLVGKPEVRGHLGDPGVDGRIILLWIFMWGYELDRTGSGKGQVPGTCECGNVPSVSMKYGEFLDNWKTGWLLKDSAPWSK